MVHVVVKLACYIITNEDPTSTGDSEPWGIQQFASTGFEAVAAGATNAHAAPWSSDSTRCDSQRIQPKNHICIGQHGGGAQM